MGNIVCRSGARFLLHQQYHLANMCFLHGNRGEFSCDVFLPMNWIANCRHLQFKYLTTLPSSFFSLSFMLIIFMTILSIVNYDYNSFILSSLSNKGIIFSKLTKISHKFLVFCFLCLFRQSSFQFSRKRAQGNEAGWVGSWAQAIPNILVISSLSRDIFAMSNGTIMIYVALPNPKGLSSTRTHHFFKIGGWVPPGQCKRRAHTKCLTSFQSSGWSAEPSTKITSIGWPSRSWWGWPLPWTHAKEMRRNQFLPFCQMYKRKGGNIYLFFWAHVSCCWGVVTWTCRWGSDYRTFVLQLGLPLNLIFIWGWGVNDRHMTYVSSITTFCISLINDPIIQAISTAWNTMCLHSMQAVPIPLAPASLRRLSYWEAWWTKKCNEKKPNFVKAWGMSLGGGRLGDNWVVGGNSQLCIVASWTAGYYGCWFMELPRKKIRNRPFFSLSHEFRAFGTFGISSILCVTKQAEDELKKTGKMTSAREERDGKNRGWSQDTKKERNKNISKETKWQMFFLFPSPRSPSRFGRWEEVFFIIQILVELWTPHKWGPHSVGSTSIRAGSSVDVNGKTQIAW